MRTYRYVGPEAIRRRAMSAPPGARIHTPADVRRWVRETGQTADRSGCVVATFVVDETGELLIADRHSEHVACASGRPVRAAGEITFAIDRDEVAVAAVSNQSTGYCPEPESWPATSAALTAAGLPGPDGYSPACVFRRCEGCGTKNIVKGDDFACGVCECELPTVYNCQSDVSLSPE